MVAGPADYRWSSHRANACGDVDPLVTPHPSFLALAPCADERRDAYRRSFGQPLSEDAVRAIRDATQFEWALGWALGGDSFGKRVEAWSGQRADRLPMGRPRTDGKPTSRL